MVALLPHKDTFLWKQNTYFRLLPSHRSSDFMNFKNFMNFMNLNTNNHIICGGNGVFKHCLSFFQQNAFIAVTNGKMPDD